MAPPVTAVHISCAVILDLGCGECSVPVSYLILHVTYAQRTAL